MAVIVTVPAFRDVSNPDKLMVATVASEVAQVTEEETFCVPPLEYVAVAVN